MINGYCDKQEQIIYGFMHLKAEEEKEEQQQQKFGVCRYVCRLTNVIFFLRMMIFTRIVNYTARLLTCMHILCAKEL